MSIGVAKNLGAGAANTSFIAFATPSHSLTTSRNNGSVTSSELTVNAEGSASPTYSFAWIKLSGDEITISNATGQIVTFSANGGGDDEFGAIYQCTVTDGAAAERIVLVNVTFLYLVGT